MSIKRKAIVFLLFIVGVGFLVYPTLACKWNAYRQHQVIEVYKRCIEKAGEEQAISEVDETGGVIGIICIPEIEVELPIYRGTSKEVLELGAGLLKGHDDLHAGKGTHAVLAAHRGMPSADMFTHLDKLKEGDTFTIQVKKEIHTYEVDQIIPMMDRNDKKGFEKAFAPLEGEECVTLLTCTPYGQNTHRLLVRGIMQKGVALNSKNR